MRRFVGLSLLAVLAGCGSKASNGAGDTPTPATDGLRGLADFQSITEPQTRAAALFDEIGKVLTHPRCSNCHPSDERPTQREGLAHHPLVVRGGEGMGAPGMHCSNCHGRANFERMPGAEGWHLAPLSMGWAGKTLSQICEQIKDPKRNGGKTLAGIVEHVAGDALVSYGWSPPEHLEPAPGSQALFAELVGGWVAAGAHCP